MSVNCNSKCVWKNPLLRDGTSQSDRFLEALQTDYAKIDERELPEFLRFTFDYAKEFNYYDLSNTDTGGDWQSFFENDVVTASKIIRGDLKKARRSFNEIKSALQLATTDGDRESELVNLLEFNIGYIVVVDGWLQECQFGPKLYEALQQVIRSQAREAVELQIAYDKGIDQALSSPPTGTFTGADYSTILSAHWGIDPSSIAADTSIMGSGVTHEAQVENAMTYLEAVFEGLIDSVERMKVASEKLLEYYLNEYPEHEPHFALFLAFLQLFMYATDHLNQLTGRHVDFFYREVLQLAEKAAVPDQVHLLFKLADNLSQHLVAADTGFDAGKDATGVKLEYRSNNEIVVNKASVNSLKTLHLGAYTTLYGTTMFHSPVANSSDGRGEPLDEINPSWKAFGQTGFEKGETSRYGFAISSPIMFMAEGKRALTVNLYLEDDANFDWADVNYNWSSKFTFRITGEKGWMEPDTFQDSNVDTSLSDKIASVTLIFEKFQDSIVGWDEELHGQSYNTADPVLEILFDHLGGSLIPYDNLERWKLKKMNLEVEVEDVTNLVLQNDQGALDPAKPFPLFTITPTRDANFYIGSSEIFSKELSEMAINIEWLDVPSNDMADYYGGYGTWKKKSSYALTPYIKKKNGSKPNRNGGFIGRLKILDDYEWKNLIATPEIVGCDYTLVPSLPLTANNSKVKKGTPTNATVKVAKKKGPAFTNAPGDSQTIRVTRSEAAANSPESQPHQPKGLQKTTTDNHSSHITNIEGSTGLSYPGGSNTSGSGNVVCNPIYSSQNNFYLFDDDDARAPIIIKVFDKEKQAPASFKYKKIYDYAHFDLLGSTYKRDPDMDPVVAYQADTRRGFVKIELASNFLHNQYVTALSQYTLITSKTVTDNKDFSSLPVPNEPYSPKVKSLSVDYKSEVTLDYEVTNEFQPNYIGYENRHERVYQIGAFGEAEIFPAPDARETPFGVFKTQYLFPQHNVTVGTDQAGAKTFVDKGYLHVGIKDLDPPQNLTLLFQFAEGTEDPEIPVPVLKWQFMSRNRWVDFRPLEIISDTTFGLVNSGVVTLAVPSLATKGNTAMPAEEHWIRIEAPSNITAFSELIAVVAQAVPATFHDQENDPNHLRAPLPGESISKFVQRDNNIKEVSQPYQSFGGRVKEQTDSFYLRASEVIRHKHRAITIWDYERLVLEAFPDIYKVKCINHTDDNSELAPGAVKVVMIPNVEQYEAVKDPFELKVGTRTLAAVTRFLDELKNPYVDLLVQNPVYETIQVEFEVAFHLGKDAEFYSNQLNEDLKRFLSPWAFGQIETIRFGGRVHQSQIINFVEELDYVDYIKNFIMRHQGACDTVASPSDLAVASTAASILVTDDFHIISVIESNGN